MSFSFLDSYPHLSSDPIFGLSFVQAVAVWFKSIYIFPLAVGRVVLPCTDCRSAVEVSLPMSFFLFFFFSSRLQ